MLTVERQSEKAMGTSFDEERVEAEAGSVAKRENVADAILAVSDALKL